MGNDITVHTAHDTCKLNVLNHTSCLIITDHIALLEYVHNRLFIKLHKTNNIKTVSPKIFQFAVT